MHNVDIVHRDESYDEQQPLRTAKETDVCVIFKVYILFAVSHYMYSF